MATGTALAALSLPPAGAQADGASALAVPGRPLGEVGTVDTIAGPGFCPGLGTVEPSSTTVRSLAVGAGGTTYVDTGLLGEGKVGKVDTDGRVSLEVTRPAGGGAAGGSSPPGEALARPGRLASDGDEGVLVAAGTSVVRLAANGALSTVVGRPAGQPAGGSGDGGSVAVARVTSEATLATDARGGVFLADRAEGGGDEVQVRFANLGAGPVVVYAGSASEITVEEGQIAAIAGGSPPGGDGPGGRVAGSDGGPAIAAVLTGDVPVMAVSGDFLYLGTAGAPPRGASAGGGFSVPSSHRREVALRVINLGGEAATRHGVTVAPGELATVAGGGPAGFAGDGGPALDAAFGVTTGIAADGDGNLFVADPDHHRVRRVDAAGVVTTFAGTGGAGPGDGGFNGNDRLATSARLHRPFDVKLGPQGRVYISDRFNHQLRFVDEVGFIRAAPGNGVGMTWNCEPGPAGAGATGALGPRRGRPSGLAVGDGGAIYLANKALPQVKVLGGSEVVDTVAGVVDPAAACPPAGCGPGDGGPALGAPFTSPASLAVAPGGALYVREDDTPRVRLVNLGAEPLTAHGLTVAPGAVETVAGDGVAGDGGNGGRAVDARLAPNGVLAADAQGTLFLAEQQSGRVRQVGPDGGITTVVGGPNGAEEPGCCRAPSGLLVDPDGDLYVSDMMGNRVWFLNRGQDPAVVHGRRVGPGELALIAGTGQAGFAGEGGPAVEAQLDFPAGLAMDVPGNLYVANLGQRDDTIRRIDLAGNITTIAGSSTGTGFNGDGLKARLTAFSEMTDIAMDACGNLLVSEEGGDRVRRVNLVGLCGEQAAGPGPGAPAGSVVLPLLVVAGAAATGAGVWLVGRRARRRP